MLGVLLAYVRKQRHEACPLDGGARGPLERGAVAASLARKHLALVGAKLFQQADVFVVNIRRTGAAFGGTESAPILAISTKLFPRHKPVFLKRLLNKKPPAGAMDVPTNGGVLDETRKKHLIAELTW
jgi:hypothetical protein